MPRARTPLAKAEVSGALKKNPQRRKGKAAPKGNGLGLPPGWFTAVQKRMWAAFKKELPWLAESDRAVMEIACVLRAALYNGEEVGVSKLNLLRLLLAQLGATPADRSKISAPAKEDDDPTEGYFGGATTH